MELSDKDIEFLKSKGFSKDEKSGFFTLIDENKTFALILKESRYKLESYEMLDDGDDGFYEDYNRFYSNDGESLESFISFYF